ncbi:uncharacterized protein K452DRAFT_226286 [Aplosporella prunicola CBS 121167]|uniref:Uncharacterized protein n=1 Tax=Aplosporella prunicola CBS 121167 TaxID=1176127 RepID=A0A6A6BI42_9PEZI|nr:uncharacterized protein K452DRAFT_226286 [Aplosporella prunicola CBS 121167]KAF2143093.1 hypothetical protein K452DRAFT_226286 [Aplosporella prunicola CBS 121167]
MFPATKNDRETLKNELFDNKVAVGALNAYFATYDSLTLDMATPAVLQIETPIVRTHQDILVLVRLLKANAHHTRTQTLALAIQSFNRNGATDEGSEAYTREMTELNRALNLAVQLLCMIDCSAKEKHSHDFELGDFKPVEWRKEETFVNFLKRILPVADPGMCFSREKKNKMKAWKLSKRAGITFKATDNIVEHLLYDPKDETVRLFHHAAFLKAQLDSSTNHSMSIACEESLAEGKLPPRLLLETLSTFQTILFPSVDVKSTKLLETLISSKDTRFDAECLTHDSHTRNVPAGMEYVYWGQRLQRLHELVTNPKPRHRLGRWLQRHNSDRNALYIAIIGLFLSVFFGFLSVLIGIFQSWVAWKAWKSQ